ncbi:hypothetical protein G6F46_007422 [Rhizopus delemar]|uniref:protein disulfide-isomerase n=3 Tax=Rhizopus TaxID=4842 RepID=I1C6R9_RHIO9|nr:hypothetical protein RO3G_08859 [Rhizopus delemar RA 99-880]KAG1460750.1 hypothetical protein G6F55_003975 [Rhizopus delemar]KAG1539215.1 hypothetical protein G6F51_009275 [Rhizopus arrhizus]KAG1493397.1 hypothetical protein G6F54_008605 [Rhizopus delemar]KAG1513787.1 hypothetical protein G6F53_004166 [Rhizopus delemar]|eukprot:EIE84149.1 hypothetical protein RO3G_08859 [Rhizopus delemar RA 99-880]
MKWHSIWLISTWILAVTGQVVHLKNQDEFIKNINQHDLVLVDFFAPSCHHCKALEPEYEQAASLLASEPLMLAKLDCTENESICSRYRVKAYPTLQLFRKGKASEVYRDEKTAEKMTEYMRKQLLPTIPTLEEKKELEELKEKESILVVAYLSPNDTASIAHWTSFSLKWMDDFAFALVTNQALSQTENIHHYPTLVLYKQFDHGQDVLEEHFDDETFLIDFIRRHSVPLLDEITPSNFYNYVEAGRPLVYLFSDKDEMKERNQADFLPLAKTYQDDFSFVHINATEYPAQAEFLSLNSTRLPALGVHNFQSGARYPFEGDWDLDRIQQFLNDIRSGRLDPVVKSQTFPPASDSAVHVLVGKEFNQVVFDSTKDVIVQIYAPWCTHSQKLAPVWQELSQRLQDLDSVVVAKMDGTVNDVPPSAGFQVVGYPTIKLIKQKTNEVVDYTGDRTLDDLVQFVHMHTTSLNPKHDEL